jgi:hypothetical protein
MKHILLFIVFLFTSLSFCQSETYSVKNRLNTRLSVSYNRTNAVNVPFMHFEGNVHPFQAMLNMRADCNYGVLNWLEIGGYIGYVRYYNMKHLKKNGRILQHDFAPAFGVNVNVHLLPFFGVKKDCRWELYLTAKYGGIYLINYYPAVIRGIILKPKPSNSLYYDTTYLNADDSDKRYRHEFGIGIGGGVYFWKVFGLYAEVLVGQYSYFPKMHYCYYTVRAGIEFKFTPKKKAKNKNKEVLPEHIEIE